MVILILNSKKLFRWLLTFLVFLCTFSTVSSQLNADFNTPTLEACGSLQATFYDQSTSNVSIIDYAWDLGTNTSSLQNPGIIFTEPGSYTICLTVTDVDGNTDTECKEDYINILPNPVASFTPSNLTGCAPLTVDYTNSSYSDNGIITTMIWDIGGSTGVVSTDDVTQVVSSTYTQSGAYSVSLYVEDEKGCRTTTTESNLINVYNIPEPEIDFSLISSCELPWEVEFINLNPEPNVIYSWDFGNGDTFVGSNPPNIFYTDIGSYDIQIFMESGECRDTVLMTNVIDTDVTAAFNFSPENVCENAPVTFNDISIIDAESVLWDFGDGNTSTEFNPIHTYSDDGCYDVTLIRNAAECSDTITISCVTVHPTPEIEYTVENQFSCLIPIDIGLSATSTSDGVFTWTYDGNTTTTADTSFSLSEFGTTYAALSFTDNLGCAAFQDSIIIELAPFEANLPVNGPAGCTPLTFNLTDSVFSTVPLVSWEWTVGNPTIFTSTESNPTFTLPDTGLFDVQLITENIYGCVDTIYLENYVKIGTEVEPDFTALAFEGCVEEPKQFLDLSSSNANEWQWFVDGDFISFSQNPIFFGDDPGTYDVTLYAGHNGCTSVFTIEDFITIFEPVSNFVLGFNCIDPYTVAIDNNSIGADSLFWTVRLSSTDSLILTDSIINEFTFPDRGIYTLSHYSKSFETGCEHTRTDTIVITDPVASYTVDTLAGCAPLEITIEDNSLDAFSYSYTSGVADVSAVDAPEPILTFTQGGLLEGPTLIITDIHECQDTFQIIDSVMVNDIVAIPDFPEVVCVPETVILSDSSTNIFGEVVEWEWSIANGAFESSISNPMVDIDSVGTYDLYLKVKDDWGCTDSIAIPHAITGVDIIPDFTSDTLGCTWSGIHFMPLGDLAIVDSFYWEFGDGNSSSESAPHYFYEDEGVYTVCLTMFDNRGCSKTICKENEVHIKDPKADFIGDPIFATCPPLLTTFNNASQNSEKYIWDFGDNTGISVNLDPSHVYTQPGSYDVTLVATLNEACSDTLILEDYIRVEGPVGSFVPDITPSCIPIDVRLYAVSDGYYSYVWDLGNGILDTVPGLSISDTISYFYDVPGKFTPKLIVTDTVGCSRSFAGDPIIVDLVDLSFTEEGLPLCGTPIEVFLENTSEGTTEEVDYTWNIVGPEELTATGKDATVEVNVPGFYSVQLIGSYNNCVDSVEINEYIEIAEDPIVTFDLESDQLCENVNVRFTNNTTLSYGEISTWLWDFGDGNTSSEFEPSHSYSVIQSYIVTLTAYSSRGCSASTTRTFDVLPSTVATAGPDQTICIGDETQISAEIENLLEGGSFYWQEDPTLSCTDCLTPTVVTTDTTQYVIVAIHPNGCESLDTIAINVVPTPGPELELAADSIVCQDTESIIDVVNFSTSNTYHWDNTITGQDCYIDCEEVTVFPSEATTYFVTVTNEYGCQSSDSIRLEIESSFEDFLIEERVICEGASTSLNVEIGENPIWQEDIEIDCTDCSEVIVAPQESQYFYVSVGSELGCRYEDSVFVQVIPSHSVEAGNDSIICLGEVVTLSASTFGDVEWSPSEIVADTNGMVTSALPIESGYIWLSSTLDECTQHDSLFVTVHKKAEIEGLGDTICVGEMALLSANGRADRYSWKIENEAILGDEVNVFPDTTTTYEVIGNFRTCIPDTAMVVAFVHPKIEYSLAETDYKIYLNTDVELEPEYAIDSMYTYSWTPPEGLDCTDCPDPIISDIQQNTDYNLFIIDEQSGCSAMHDIRVRYISDCTQSIFHIANIFSPNADGINDNLLLKTNNPDEFISMHIFDRWGELLFQSEDINQGWDGKFQNTLVQPGVYVIKLQVICPETSETSIIFADVTVVR